MSTAQLTASTMSVKNFGSLESGLLSLKPSTVHVSSISPTFRIGSLRRACGVVRVAATVAPKFTTVKPLGDRVLIKIKVPEEKSTGGILLPSSAQTKPQAGEVVAVGEGKTIGTNKVGINLKEGAQVVYSKYTGTEVDFNGSQHLILKEDDIVGVLETDDVEDLKPLNDRILIKVPEVEEKTAGGLLLRNASKEKPSIGTVIAVGPGSLDEEGNRKPLSASPGNTVLYSKYAGSDFKGPAGSEYIALRESDLLAILF